MSETSSMERARCKAAAAPRNNSAGGAAGWTALRAPESREECEMLYAYACHVCGPVNLTGETRTETCNNSHTPSEPRSIFMQKNIRNIARASEIVNSERERTSTSERNSGCE